MSHRDDRRREARARRVARTQKLGLRKSRRDGRYVVFDPGTNVIVAGDLEPGRGLTLDEVEHVLHVEPPA